MVDKFLVELQTQLDGKKITLDITDDAREWLAVNGYDEKMGARPMARIIQEKIKKPLAELVLFGALSEKGGSVLIDVKDDQLTITDEARR